MSEQIYLIYAGSENQHRVHERGIICRGFEGEILLSGAISGLERRQKEVIFIGFFILRITKFCV